MENKEEEQIGLIVNYVIRLDLFLVVVVVVVAIGQASLIVLLPKKLKWPSESLCSTSSHLV